MTDVSPEEANVVKPYWKEYQEGPTRPSRSRVRDAFYGGFNAGVDWADEDTERALKVVLAAHMDEAQIEVLLDRLYEEKEVWE